MELKVTQLTKQYGLKTAVDHLDITLSNGVYGLLGANGAGKTTLMRLLFPPLGKLLWMERIYPFLERDTAICWDICRSILDTILSLLLGIF